MWSPDDGVTSTRFALGCESAKHARAKRVGVAPQTKIMLIAIESELAECYFLAAGCFNGSQAPCSWLLATHCWMKYMPSMPSYTLG